MTRNYRHRSVWKQASAVIALLLAPRLAPAATCTESLPCPSYFECVDGACVEEAIECGGTCAVSHLSCGPTGTTGGSAMQEPAPSDFRCNWGPGSCEDARPCPENFECLPCEPPERNFSCSNDQCVPSRLPCQSHDDCPEFFHCYEFAADEVPDYWPPGAGRACKPLLGVLYAPQFLSGGTLLESSAETQPGGAGNGPTPDGDDSRTSAGCGCRVERAAAQRGWWLLGWLALVGLCVGRGAARSRSGLRRATTLAVERS